MWEKFVLAGLDLGSGIKNQCPGQVPGEVFEGFKDEMNALPVPKKYAKKKEVFHN